MNLLQISSLIISVISLAVATIALISTSGTKRLKNEFFVGKSGGNLEEFIVKQNQKINESSTGHADLMEASVRDLRELQKISVQKMSVIRYNPFKDDGGNLSFSLALLDGKDNGLVITSDARQGAEPYLCQAHQKWKIRFHSHRRRATSN